MHQESDTPAYIQQLRHDLAHVYWLGGSACAGKSSVAEMLARTYDLRLYQTDEAYVRHEKVVTPQKQPVFFRLAHASSEELWMRSVDQQVEEEIALYYEEFTLILEELLALSASSPLLVEGNALLPACVLPLLEDAQHAFWMVPTAEFQLHYYAQRPWTKDVVKACSDPEQALQNWMQRDIRFARYVEQEATRQGMRVLTVDGRQSLAENIAVVEHHFQPGR